jgi:hypothetical protein
LPARPPVVTASGITVLKEFSEPLLAKEGGDEFEVAEPETDRTGPKTVGAPSTINAASNAVAEAVANVG